MPGNDRGAPLRVTQWRVGWLTIAAIAAVAALALAWLPQPALGTNGGVDHWVGADPGSARFGLRRHRLRHRHRSRRRRRER